MNRLPENPLRPSRFLPATLAIVAIAAFLLPAPHAAALAGDSHGSGDGAQGVTKTERRIVALSKVGTDNPRLLWNLVGGGYLGVELVDLTPELRAHYGLPEDRGVLVARVREGSPAERAGVAVGDFLTSVDGEPMASAHDVGMSIRRHEAGEQADLVVWRGGSSLDLRATVEERERPQIHMDRMMFKAPEAGEDGEPHVFRWRAFSDGDNDPEIVFEAEDLERFTESIEAIDWPRLEGGLLTERNRELETRLKELEEKLESLQEKLQEMEDLRR